MSAEYGLCLHCYEIIDPLTLDRNHNGSFICPKMSCNFMELALVDENMLAIIITLNKKGYRTTDCCSAHLWDNGMYIVFEAKIQIPIEPPEGFYLSTDTVNTEVKIGIWEQQIHNRIYCSDFDHYSDEDYKRLTLFEKQERNFEMIQRLFKWAESLPEIREEVN